jgi:hypothetical protein
MATPQTVNTVAGSQNVQGYVYAQGLVINNPTINDAMLLGTTAAPINGSKVSQENPGVGGSWELFAPTTSIAALTKNLGIAWQAGNILGFQALIAVAGSGTTPVVTVDLQTWNGSAWVSVLTAVITLSAAASTNAPNTPYPASIVTPTYAAGAVFRTVVAVSGGGTYPEGLLIGVLAKENPT